MHARSPLWLAGFFCNDAEQQRAIFTIREEAAAAAAALSFIHRFTIRPNRTLMARDWNSSVPHLYHPKTRHVDGRQNDICSVDPRPNTKHDHNSRDSTRYTSSSRTQ